MRMQLLIRATVAVALAGSGVAAGADSGANAGRDIAANCASCHGADGRSRNAIPIIVGQDKTYLVQQLKDFRDGKRPSTIMQQLVKGYTDGQLEAAATYLSLQKPD
jgi:sulfide dehydrogenase cytochrome subunit